MPTDLKPENLLFRSKAPDADIMIADFGLSRVMEANKFSLLTEICGTPGVSVHSCFFFCTSVSCFLIVALPGTKETGSSSGTLTDVDLFDAVHGSRDLQKEYVPANLLWV